MRFRQVLFAIALTTAALHAQPISVAGVIEGAGFSKTQAVSPGSVVAIFGSGLASDTIISSTVPLSTNLGGVSVTVNGIAAPLFFVSAGQINVQLPWNLPTSGTTNVVVTRGTTASPVALASMAASSPGIFSIPPGAGWAVAINADGSLAAPSGAIPGISTHPAKAGDGIVLYTNGLGAVDSTPGDGAASLDKLRNTLSPPIVMVGSKNAQVIFSGLTPQFPGINQVNFIVPTGVTGTLPVQLQMGGITTSDKVTIAIQ